MKHIFIALVLILTFIGCESGGQKDEIIIKRNLFYSEKYPITIDQSSPEKLLKSYWTYLTWTDTTYQLDTTKFMFLTSETKNTCLQHYKKRRQDNLNDLFRQNNQIDSIVSQSDYRSIIFTREYSYHGDDFPSTWKYIFSKSNNKWEIDGIYEFCEICGGEGENYLKRKCPFCDGTGWDNNLF